MNMPGFTAELSLYHPSEQYHTSQVRPAAEMRQGANFQLVTPQLPIDPWGLRCRLNCLNRFHGILLQQCLDNC
jgi:hypothetical protein